MSHADPTPDAPEVPKRVRTVAYFVLLGLGVVVALTAGLAPIWAPEEIADKIVRSTVVVTSVMALIGGGLGVVYRPTR